MINECTHRPNTKLPPSPWDSKIEIWMPPYIKKDPKSPYDIGHQCKESNPTPSKKLPKPTPPKEKSKD